MSDIGIFTRRRIISPAESYFAAPAAAVGGAYTAQGVTFPNSPYLTGTASTNFTGAVDGTSALVSFWFKILGNDSSYQLFFEQDGAAGTGLAIIRWVDNTWRIEAKTSAGATVFFAISTSTFLAAGATWHHLACAYTNLTTPLLYIDGVSNLGSEGHLGGTIDFTTGVTHTVMNRSGGSLLANANVADFYVAPNQYLDISVAANLQKFRSSGGNPVDLGSDGSTPTGTAPLLYLSSTVASWHVNKGTGGNLFTVTGGPLAAASTNPP